MRLVPSDFEIHSFLDPTQATAVTKTVSTIVQILLKCKAVEAVSLQIRLEKDITTYRV